MLVISISALLHSCINNKKCEMKGKYQNSAQLSSTKYKVKTVRIPTKNYRLQAQVLHFPESILLWINSYFPTDPLTVRYNDNELLEVLSEVEDIMDKTE